MNAFSSGCCRIFLTFILIGLGTKIYAQEFVQGMKPKPVICYSSNENAHTQVDLPKAYLKRKNKSQARTTASSHFQVTYIDFTDPAKQAFQRAVDIWESLLISPITIHIEARWTDLSSDGSGVLGQAGPAALFSRPELMKANVWYPVALAEKLAGRELNTPGSPDITAAFNSKNNSWYYGLDGKTPTGQTDLVTVVLHEIGHGLGFSGSMGATGTMASWGQNGRPYAFDSFVMNEAGTKLVDTDAFKNPSTQLRTQLTNSKIYFDSPLARKVNNGVHPKLYAPSSFNRGSSISHLDESSYPSGTANSLMTPFIASAEAIHDPGSLLLQMLAEMGWRATTIQHQPMKDVETTDQPITIKAIIQSDDQLIAGSPELHYTAGAIKSLITLKMQSTGNPNEYAASIPAPGDKKLISYYISASDTTKRTFTNPGEAPQNYYSFYVGIDTIAPIISLSPIDFVFVDYNELSVEATATDNRGVEEVVVEYFINTIQQPSFELQLTDTEKQVYSANFPIEKGSLKTGDQIQYRVIAKDISIRTNQAYSPQTDYYTFVVNEIAAPQVAYSNQFNSSSNDFVGGSFSITTSTGFTDGAIHSEHPYRNGTGVNFESNYTYQLLVPILVRSENATLRFDEIVLVEPGEEGATFGEDNFFDYVVVEGSKDKGKTWLPIEDGYDSRYYSLWLSTYNSALTLDGDSENSTAVGKPSLYKLHSLSLLNTFSPKDTILVRFRLFADQLSHGWGWAIDNLAIQGATITGVEPATTEAILIYPNPTFGTIKIKASHNQSIVDMRIVVNDVLGNQVFAETYVNQLADSEQEADLSHLASGMYFVKVQVGNQYLTKKIFVVK